MNVLLMTVMKSSFEFSKDKAVARLGIETTCWEFHAGIELAKDF